MELAASSQRSMHCCCNGLDDATDSMSTDKTDKVLASKKSFEAHFNLWTVKCLVTYWWSHSQRANEMRTSWLGLVPGRCKNSDGMFLVKVLFLRCDWTISNHFNHIREAGSLHRAYKPREHYHVTWLQDHKIRYASLLMWSVHRGQDFALECRIHLPVGNNKLPSAVLVLP